MLSENILHFTGFLTSWKKNVSSTTKCQCTQFTQLYYSYLQSIARPLGQPSVVFTIDKAWDPSLQALMILAGRNQSVQNIYLKEEHKKTHQMTYKPSYIMYLSRVNMWTTLTFLFVPHIHIPKKKKKNTQLRVDPLSPPQLLVVLTISIYPVDNNFQNLLKCFVPFDRKCTYLFKLLRLSINYHQGGRPKQKYILQVTFASKCTYYKEYFPDPSDLCLQSKLRVVLYNVTG